MKILNANLKFQDSLLPLSQVKKIIIHHTVTPVNMSILDIHRMHLNRGWLGVGYNFIIHANGSIFEGRGYKKGSHSGDWNSKSIGIALIGDFTKQAPTEAQYNSLAWLCLELMKKYNLSEETDIIGHREVMPTACPGPLFSIDKLERKISDLKKPPAPKKDSLALALEKLKAKGKLNDPTYWNTHARPGGKPNPEYVAQIIKRFAESI